MHCSFVIVVSHVSIVATAKHWIPTMRGRWARGIENLPNCSQKEQFLDASLCEELTGRGSERRRQRKVIKMGASEIK